MKVVFSFVAFLWLGVTPAWQTDLAKAEADARAAHKLVLLNFSGSDWCIPCIRMRKEIFDSPEFSAYAADHLVLVNADFPRLKKNRLGKDQVKKNEAAADRYNPAGSFPLTVLLDANGKVLKKWEGYPDETPARFVDELKTLDHARN